VAANVSAELVLDERMMRCLGKSIRLIASRVARRRRDDLDGIGEGNEHLGQD
jgi:hypothetical protein